MLVAAADNTGRVIYTLRVNVFKSQALKHFKRVLTTCSKHLTISFIQKARRFLLRHLIYERSCGYLLPSFSSAQSGLHRNHPPKQHITYLMGIIFFGSKQIPIGYEELFVKCPCCETHHWTDVMVISRYYHIYWLPMFPFDKEANLICKKCGLKRFGLSFDARLFNNFEEVRGKFRHPWYTYTGIGLFCLIVISVIASSAL